jgi:hypothetical protein
MSWAQHFRLQSFFRFTATFKVLTTWGICFPLKGIPCRLNTRGFVTVLPRSPNQIGAQARVQKQRQEMVGAGT